MLPRRACLSASAGLSCFEHVQNSSTSSTLMETIPRPYWFVLRSYYDVQVLTASIKFLGRGDICLKVELVPWYAWHLY